MSRTDHIELLAKYAARKIALANIGQVPFGSTLYHVIDHLTDRIEFLRESDNA
jgi:hypothetical protein